jgi:glycosyltransferase involved in cell wall biosynthesis
VKTGQTSLSVVQVNFHFDQALTDPDALLDRYATLTGWSEAVLAAGARRSSVVQRFGRGARRVRNGVEYVFVNRRVSQTVASADPDLAHVNGLAFPMRTWMLRRALFPRAAIVVQNHSDTGPMGRAPALRALGRATRGAADAYLFAAHEHVERWRRAGFIGPYQSTYQVMEASTQLEPIARSAARTRTGVAGSPALLWVGRLNANKDPLTVLDALERAVGDLPSATLTMIYGEDDLIDAVRARIARSATLGARVRLLGRVAHQDLSAFYSAADLFVLGSHYEGSGYALLEALACGAIPIVTDIPTFRVLTGGGAVGALWPVGDAAACARAVVAASRRDLSAERQVVIDHFTREFSWPAIGRRAIEIYETVIAHRIGY